MDLGDYRNSSFKIINYKKIFVVSVEKIKNSKGDHLNEPLEKWFSFTTFRHSGLNDGSVARGNKATDYVKPK